MSGKGELMTEQDRNTVQNTRRQQLAERGITMTRKEYMEQPNKHHEYYSQFVTEYEIDLIKRYIGVDRIMASTDRHFNDIPLSVWDNLVHDPTAISNLAVSNTFTQAPGSTPSISLSDKVCLGKAAARIIKERGHK